MFDKIKWLFFDVGSTLVDETIAYEHGMGEIAKRANVTYEAVYEKAMEIYRQNGKGDLGAAKHFGVELPKWYSEDEVLYDDTVKALEFLSSQYRIGVIANQNFGTEDRLIQYGILQYIDVVVASAEEGVAKPDRRIFEIALQRSHCQPEEAVMIGDRIDNDIIPAKELGMHTVWIKQGFGKYGNITGELEKADYIVNDLTELCSLFN